MSPTGDPGGDPASCNGEETCTKRIRSARGDASTFPAFEVVAGDRVAVTIGTPPAPLAGFSDPDIIARRDGSFLLHVSSGANTLAYTAASLDGDFQAPPGAGDPPLREPAARRGPERH